MQCDEKKEICLNYAANIPEWKLALILDALAKLGDASRCCGTVQKAVAGGQSYMRLHPDSEYAGEDQACYVHICQEAARALGRAVYAVEIVLSQSDCFWLAKDLAYMAETAYNSSYAELESMCREHGCKEVEYKHGQNDHL